MTRGADSIPTPIAGGGSAAAMHPSELVMRFLSSVGRPAEAEQYLRMFRDDRPERFAVIHVSEAVVHQALEALVADLRYLSALGLVPVLAFGATSTRGARRQAERVLAELEGTCSAMITSAQDAAEHVRRDVIALVPLDGNELPGDATSLDPEHAADPVIDRRIDALSQLIGQVGANKVVFLGRRSGLQPRDGRVISIVDLTTEADSVAKTLTESQRKLLRQIDRLIQHVPHRITVSVTSPLDLLRELFTVKGAGTLVRRSAAVRRYPAWRDFDGARMQRLIENAFGRTLAPDFAGRPIAAAYVADDYRGAAIIVDTPLAPYLSKFAVTTLARGEGIGRDLWHALSHDLPRLFWRSRAENPITSWYREQCDGFQRIEADGVRWVVLWRGLAPTELAAAIAYCASAPPDFGAALS